MHEVLVNSLGGLSLPRKSVIRLTDRPNMTLDVCGRKTTNQQQQPVNHCLQIQLFLSLVLNPMHSERPKLYRVLAVLSAVGLKS